MKLKVISGNTYLVRHWWRWYLVKPARPWLRISQEIEKGLMAELQYQSGKANQQKRIQATEKSIRDELSLD